MTMSPFAESVSPQMPDRPREAQETEIELGTLWEGIRRRLPWILLSVALVTPAIYFWSKSQPDQFESSATLMTSGTAGIPGAGDSLIRASTLPEGSLQEALQGPVVLGKIIESIKAESGLSAPVKSEITTKLRRELQNQELRTIELSARLDPGNNGIYTVSAKGPTPQASALLADTAAEALLNWDKSRALGSLNRADRSFRAQLREIDRQLAAGGLDDLERQTLVAARANAQRNLAQTSIQAEGVTGSLELVSPAVTPLRPVAPRPMRNAVLAGLLTLLLGTGIAALRTVTDRTVRSEDDLLSFGLPTVGMIPRLKQRAIVMNGIIRAARDAGLYESLGFLRVNLLSQLGQRPGRRVMITSTVPGEGKSSLTAALADGFASSGQRVLLIDADLRRSTQEALWDKYDREHSWVQLSGQGGVRNLQDALRNPADVQVMETEPNLHVLPAGPSLHDSMALLNQVELGSILQRWSEGYDVVLVDSPPLLAIADGLILGKHMDAVVLLVEEGKTSMQVVRQALRRARNAGLPILGFVLNKVTLSGRETYSYGYSARSARQESR